MVVSRIANDGPGSNPSDGIFVIWISCELTVGQSRLFVCGENTSQSTRVQSCVRFQRDTILLQGLHHDTASRQRIETNLRHVGTLVLLHIVWQGSIQRVCRCVTVVTVWSVLTQSRVWCASRINVFRCQVFTTRQKAVHVHCANYVLTDTCKVYAWSRT